MFTMKARAKHEINFTVIQKMYTKSDDTSVVFITLIEHITFVFAFDFRWTCLLGTSYLLTI